MNNAEALSMLQAAHTLIATAIAGLGGTASAPGAGGGSLAGGTADDADLDGKYGDPILRFKPRDWNGDDFKGCNFSQCPPDLLDMLAESLDYFAKKSDERGETTASGKPKGAFERKDAARARGWAKRIRSGWRAPAGTFEEQAAEPAEDPFMVSELTDDDIPF